jgi:hypothetical protein
MARDPHQSQPRSVMEVDWPFFGELCRGLALKVWRDYEPDLVVGIAKAGVIPAAVIATILRREFASVALTRRREGDPPALVSRPTLSPKGKRVLLVDETCDSGDTMRLAASVMREEGAKEVRTAVSFRGGAFKPDYYAIQTPDFIILPWDREVIEGGDLVVRPDYEAARTKAGTAAQGHRGTEKAGTAAQGHRGTEKAGTAAQVHRGTGKAPSKRGTKQR